MAGKKVFHETEKWGKSAIYSREGKHGRTFYIRFWFNGVRYAEKAGVNLDAAEWQLGLRHREMLESPATFEPKAVKNKRKREQVKRQREHEGLPFSKFAERFLKDYDGCKRTNYYRQVVDILVAWFRDKPLGKITPQDVKAFRDGKPSDFPAPPADFKGQDPRTRRAPGPSTLRKRLTVLGTMFRQAKDWKLVESSPVEGVKKPREPKGRLVYFDEVGFARFLGELAPEYQPIARLAVLLGGPRRGDLLGLRWSDVDFDQGLVWIGNRKTGDSLYNPMNTEARALLTKLQQRVLEIQKRTDPARIIPWVFVDGEGRDYTDPKRAYIVSQVFERAQKRAGVYVRRPFHTLRHTAGSWMTQAGVPLHHVSKVLGHKNIATTMRYAHLQPNHLKDAMTALDERVSSGGPTRGEQRRKERWPAPSPNLLARSGGASLISRQ